MKKNRYINNISSTVCVLGLALSSMSPNSTLVINTDYHFPSGNYSPFNEDIHSSSIAIMNNARQIPKIPNRLEKESTELFGAMRDATEKERESVNRYIRSISKDTGVNFFDLC